jgi:hypothetical protein
MVQAVMAAGQATPVGHRPHPSATGHTRRPQAMTCSRCVPDASLASEEVPMPTQLSLARAVEHRIVNLMFTHP